jgi:hypothetical protein
MPVNIAKAIMPAMPTAGLDPQSSRNEIKLVMEYENVINVDLVKPRNLGNWKAGFVHKALRLHKNDFF